MTDFDVDAAWEDFVDEDDNQTSAIFDISKSISSISSISSIIPSNPTITHEVQEYITNMRSGVDTRIPNPAPLPTELKIATRTKSARLSRNIDISQIFWNIPVINYQDQQEGIVLKQTKLTSATPEELDAIMRRIDATDYEMVRHNIVTHIEKDIGRIRFKDIRGIIVGMSQDDFSAKPKKKSTFYNCIVLIVRIHTNEKFKEFHVKVFNTGNMEFPGVQDDMDFKRVAEIVCKGLNIAGGTVPPEPPVLGRPQTPLAIGDDVGVVGLDVGLDVGMELDAVDPPDTSPLTYTSDPNNIVLVNSNFNANFTIDRTTLYELLMYKYHLNCAYDPCSYPGIRVVFYYNPAVSDDMQTGIRMSDTDKTAAHDMQSTMTSEYSIVIMIFRTGSVIIVGKSTDKMLFSAYKFINRVLQIEHDPIKTNDVVRKRSKPTREHSFTYSYEHSIQ
jgi:TATA-box binding protein (TBP) (component of TFIID and TFIIIB)